MLIAKFPVVGHRHKPVLSKAELHYFWLSLGIPHASIGIDAIESLEVLFCRVDESCQQYQIRKLKKASYATT